MSIKNNVQARPGWSLDRREPKVIESLMPLWDWLYHHYFRVQTGGWHNIPPHEKVLLVGSHNGGLAAPDMFMMMYDWFRRFGYERPVYGLMHPRVWEVSLPIAQMAEKAGAIMAHPKMAIAALRQGASVLVYPGGAEDVFRPHQLRDRIYFAGRTGFIKLALREEVPIVPVISHGAHDTLIVLTDIYKQMQQLHEWGMPWLFDIDPVVFPIYLGLPWGLAIGPLPHIPLPVTIHTRVCPPIIFERYGRDAASDREYVDVCYETVCTQMQQELYSLIKRSQAQS
ncbi:lysophospholipid acyltransferase family protein [Argonema antarcticum]|uniref:lysophospholipid acyltransferase family protein n=1 Tax=Argonema antarcticum TaxID=2942763 RepID=UPI002012C0BE|nr:lysophospholipid acyltransferase family protein [Argonema antarcticum]MCL1472711.1 acyltransferase family protein [Argonema antarcticum A004/B2]